MRSAIYFMFHYIRAYQKRVVPYRTYSIPRMHVCQEACKNILPPAPNVKQDPPPSRPLPILVKTFLPQGDNLEALLSKTLETNENKFKEMFL